jgi:DNA-binding IscR family transcriptional regulator
LADSSGVSLVFSGARCGGSGGNGSVEGPQSEPGCLLGERVVCSDDRPCAAHEAWKKVKTAYVEFLTTKTVADISALDATPAEQQFGKNRKKPRGRR